LTKWNIDKGKKVSGGRIHQYRKKRRFQRMSLPLLTEIGKEKTVLKRGRGNTVKTKSVKIEFVNVNDLKTKKRKKVKILDIVSNPANPHYVRRGIVTKGCVVKTDIGNVKITSRPSQVGIASGFVVQEK